MSLESANSSRQGKNNRFEEETIKNGKKNIEIAMSIASNSYRLQTKRIGKHRR